MNEYTNKQTNQHTSTYEYFKGAHSMATRLIEGVLIKAETSRGKHVHRLGRMGPWYCQLLRPLHKTPRATLGPNVCKWDLLWSLACPMPMLQVPSCEFQPGGSDDSSSLGMSWFVLPQN